jgi:hypothetical protein
MINLGEHDALVKPVPSCVQEHRTSASPAFAGADHFRHDRDADHDSDRQRRLAQLNRAACSPGFPFVNLFAVAVAVACIIAVMLWGGQLRCGAILIGLAVGTLCYAFVKPLSLAAGAAIPLFVTPQVFPFDFANIGMQRATRVGSH